MRLIQVAEHYWWEIDGQLASSGAPELTRLPFRRFILALMHISRPAAYGEDAEVKIRDWEAWLFAPLDLTDPDNVSQDVIDDEMASFLAFAGQAGGSK